MQLQEENKPSANAQAYAYRVIWSEEDQEFVGLCAEFPSLSHLATNQIEALQGIVELVGALLVDMAADGETPPEPISKRPFSGKIALRIDPDLHRELTLEASEKDTSLNRLLNYKLAHRN